MGARIGASQGTVYRIEHGRTVPSVKQVRLWLDAVGEVVTADERRRIVELAESVQSEVRGWDELLGRDGHAQREAAQLEAVAASVRNFQPTVVPGLLQTPEYARAVFSVGRTRDVDAAVAARVARQRVLYEPGRAFAFLVAEQVLRWPIGGREVLAAQLDRIVSLARLNTVTFGVLPAGQTVACLWNNFILWTLPDEAARVTVERTDGETDTSDEGTVALHEGLWSRLWEAAVHDGEAVELVRRAL